MSRPRRIAEILDDFILVRTVKATLILTADEVAALVRLDPVTWVRALRRGKAYRRGQATERRQAAERTRP